MKHVLFGAGAAVALGTMTALVLAAPARPVKWSPTAAAAVLKEIEKDRADTQKWLQSDPTSYLATVDRRDFEQKKTLIPPLWALPPKWMWAWVTVPSSAE